MAKNLSGVSEVDMIISAVRIAASRPGAKISTSELIKELMAWPEAERKLWLQLLEGSFKLEHV